MTFHRLIAHIRKTGPRVWIRTGFLVVFLISCVQLWRYYQWALGNGPFVNRPEATAGFVPLGAAMSISAWIKSGVFDAVMPASVVIMLAAFALSFLFKRGFCGYVCPVGSIAAALGWLGRKLNGGKPRPINKKLDIALRVPKFLVGFGILIWMASLPAQVGLDFQQIPYYATADLKILYGLLHPAWGYIVLVMFVVATSLFIGTNTWCRYLCPLGGIYGGCSVASLSTVKRDAEQCIDCKACDHACAARIEVSTTTRAIRDTECDGCQDCVRVCPAPGAIDARVLGATIPWWIWPVMILVIWLFIWGFAVATGHWQEGLPHEIIAQFMRIMKTSHDF